MRGLGLIAVGWLRHPNAQVVPVLRRQPDVRDDREGLVIPWALAFLPDGRMLVTERPGRMRIVRKDGKLSPPIAGVPKVGARPGRPARRRARPRLRAEHTIYFCYADPVGGGARTSLARAQLVDEARRGSTTSR